ncbi:MAG: aspartate kinase, partial [Verrucomicrobiota bacterium]
SEWGTVSAIGAGINANGENLQKGCKSLVEAGIAPNRVHTSSFRISWLLPSSSVTKAVSLLHRIYLEEGNSP